MASKLHGVDVDIKIIKRKGDPLDPLPQPPLQQSLAASNTANNLAAGKDNVNQQTTNGANNNNNNTTTRCPNEFMSSSTPTSNNNLNGVKNTKSNEPNGGIDSSKCKTIVLSLNEPKNKKN